jgi:hypothetical protein
VKIISDNNVTLQLHFYLGRLDETLIPVSLIALYRSFQTKILSAKIFDVRDIPSFISLLESRYTGVFGISRSPIIKAESEYLKRFPIAVYMSLSSFVSTITFHARGNR